MRTNRPSLNDCLYMSPTIYTQSVLGRSQRECHGQRKGLGVIWDTSSNGLVLDPREIYILAKEIHPSKGTVASTIGKFYDSLGITSPIITPFKVFLQRFCVVKVTWDEPLTGNLLKEWEELIRGLGGDPSLSIPRCYHKESTTHPIQSNDC